MRLRISAISTTILLFSCCAYILAGNTEKNEINSKKSGISELERTALKAFVSNDPLAPIEYLLLIESSANSDLQGKRASYHRFIADVSKFQTENNDQRALSNLFYRVHRKYLKSYQPLASFEKLLENGNYNCLTGTALYALALEHLGYDYKIIERKYHIYLLVTTDQGEILIESTDPIEGFITNEKEILDRISSYSEAEETNSGFYSFEGKVNNSVELYQLIGLHYYNAAVGYFNQEELKLAYQSMQKALVFYRSERFAQFSELIRISDTIARGTQVAVIQGN